MTAQTKIDYAPPAPTHTFLGRVTAVFYNRNLAGKPYGAVEYMFPESYTTSDLNFEAEWYLRDHFAVWNGEGKLLHDGPVLNALGKPIETYSEAKARRAQVAA